MESLRESSEREKIHVAGVLAAHKEIVAAKQRAEAAEKERDEAAKVIAEQIGALRDAGSRMAELEMARRRAEKRSADLMGALRSIIIRCREGDKRTDWLPIIDGIARAALHDEERSAPPQREKP